MRKLAVIFAAGMLLLGTMNAGNYERKGCKVVDVSGDLVTVEDVTGNLWEFTEEGYNLGDRVSLKMNGKGTDFIEDDVILSVEKVEG